MPTPIRHRVARLALRGRVTARRDEHATLRRDLELFRSPNELTDLAAILRQYPDDETATIRQIVDFTRAS